MEIKFLNSYGKIKPYKQKGSETFFSKRTKKDSELNINQTIAEQFNLLRIVDNDRYPAYFIIKNQKYFLKIYKENNKD